MKEAMIGELLQHATDELRRAGMIAGGYPARRHTNNRTEEGYDVTSCGYDGPDDPFAKTLLDQNIKGDAAPTSSTENFWRQRTERTRHRIVWCCKSFRMKWSTKKTCKRSLKISR